LIFVDTSAIYALADSADPRHVEAKRLLSSLVERSEILVTHNYILVESIALIQNRLGANAALKTAASADAFDVEWVDRNLHERAVLEFGRSARRGVSLVDQVSFLLMRARRIETAFAFDRDFVREGFRQYSG
jgi:predicted nucleic acid-binding protein